MRRWILRRITGRRVDRKRLAELEELDRRARMLQEAEYHLAIVHAARDEAQAAYREYVETLARGQKHRYRQIPGARVRVCECGQWPDHHLHTGDRQTCNCDECRKIFRDPEENTDGD